MPTVLRKWKVGLIMISLFAGVNLFVCAEAEALDTPEPSREVLIKALRQVYRQSVENKKDIEQLRQVIQETEPRDKSDLVSQPGEPPVAGEEKETRQNDPGGSPGGAGPQPRNERDAQSRRRNPKEDTATILVEKGGVLIPQGTLIVEPSINYTHISQNYISLSGYTIFNAIHIGKIDVHEIKRDVLTSALTFRYGLLDWLQLDCRIPYVNRWEHRLLPKEESSSDETVDIDLQSDGLGDIEVALNLHIWRNGGKMPDVLFHLKGKSRSGRDPYETDYKTVEGQQVPDNLPTGSGFYGLSSGFTLVKACDPVVFYGSLSYFWNIERDIGGAVGKVDPGDSIEYSLGMATALNEKISLSFSFQNIYTSTTDMNGEAFPDSELNAANFLVGVGYSLSPNVSLSSSFGMGLTEDSSDYQLQFSVPVFFKLF